MKSTTPSKEETGVSQYNSTDDGGSVRDSLGRVPIIEIDNLDETVLGAAAVGNPDLLAPEIAWGTGELTEWDEPVNAAGTWTPREGRDDGMLDADRLVEAGIEEAERERRVAAGESGEG